MNKLQNRLKGLFNRYTILLLFTYFVFGIGFSYAYFAYQYQNDSVIAGNVIAINATLDVQLIVGSNDKMVPMQNDALSNALNGLEHGGQAACVDANGNLSCQVYKITLNNTGSRLQHITGTVELYAKDGVGNAYSNLKWQELTNPTTIKTDSIVNSMSESPLVMDLTMESGDTKEWYIAVWISEIDDDQRNLDKGLFGGTVTFETTDGEVMYLNTVEPGSYVAYAGDSVNGCDNTTNINGWTSCGGKNANYVSDTDMGYCNWNGDKFNVNGWRVAYIEDESAHLVSAGAPECVATYIENIEPFIMSSTSWTAKYYGSDYIFDDTTGIYTLINPTSSKLDYSNNYDIIINEYPYACEYSETITCSIMSKVDSTSTSSTMKYYWYKNSENTAGLPVHLSNLNSTALKYCNSNYIKDGVCNNTTAWPMNVNDFEKITGTPLNHSSCYGPGKELEICGLYNSLIDNGGTYWFATPFDGSSSMFAWYNPGINDGNSNGLNGVRPVLALDPLIIVIDGEGTYEDPYIIAKQ